MSKGIWESFRFPCGLSAKNRVVMAPLTNMQSPTSELSDDEYHWLRLRIQGEYAMVVTCASHVVQSAQSWPGELGIFEDRHEVGFSRLGNAGRENNCLVLPQLFHGGFRAPSQLTGVQPVSASAFTLSIPEFEQPRVLQDDEIVSLIDSFGAAAKRANRAGLPGVEIHGANGYLFTQFLSPATNHRADRWGGNLENRSRFLLETVKKARQEIGSSKILGVRLSPESTKLISSIDIDEMIDVADMLCDASVDYISLSLWDALKIPDKYPSGAETIVERFRKSVPSRVPLIVSGKIWDLEQACRVYDAGADFVALGAAAIANPEWPRKAREPGFKPARLPLTRSQLLERGVSDRFSAYLERWGYVKGEN